MVNHVHGLKGEGKRSREGLGRKQRSTVYMETEISEDNMLVAITEHKICIFMVVHYELPNQLSEI